MGAALTRAKALDVSTEEPASAAAMGAPEAAGEIDTEPAAQVRSAVTGTIAGVKMAMVISTRRIVTTPKSRAEGVGTLAAQLGPVRVQPGCHRCDLYQDIENWEAIALVEEWESQAELDLRLRSEE